MNQYLFATRNVLDKVRKIVKTPGSAEFYLRTYVLSRLDRVVPDVYVVSYPKCGRTWVRTMLERYTNLLSAPSRRYNDRGIITVGPSSILVKFEHGQGNWVPAPPRLESLSFNRDRYANRKVVFLVRDPRDVLVSSWYHLKFRENIYQGDLSQFVRDELVGIEKVVAFMNLWLEHQSVPKDFLLMTYEELHEQPETSFATLLQFMGIEPDREKLHQAVSESSFDRMKKMEVHGDLKEPWMQPGAKDLDRSLKVRKGKIGGFREELSPADIEYVDRVIRERLSPTLGYGGGTTN